jgi:hypothetical protein
MLVNPLGPLVLLGTLLGWSPVNASPSAYDEAVTRAAGLLPRQPDQIVVVERDEGSDVLSGKAHVEAFVNHGGRVIYLIKQGVTLQATLKGPGIFDYALATVIWHEMAHIDGADEAAAQEAEEQLWMEFIVTQRVDGARGMRYLALLKKRRALPAQAPIRGRGNDGPLSSVDRLNRRVSSDDEMAPLDSRDHSSARVAVGRRCARAIQRKVATRRAPVRREAIERSPPEAPQGNNASLSGRGSKSNRCATSMLQL